ncbi:MAG: hypothetical protein L6Q76_22080 [Polyangiaceae bacterium]|nr:hypothetical protein [Polyangiaceae bacterium]
MSKQPRLAVHVDGVALSEDEARELWTKFSQHMDENKGDMAGFAKLCGYARVSPEARKGQAVLVIQTTEGAPTAEPARPERAPNGGGKRPKRRR